VDSVSTMFAIIIPKNIQATAITAPIPSDGQCIVSLDDCVVVFNDGSLESIFLIFSTRKFSVVLSSSKKKLGTLSFEDGSESGFMFALKNHIDLGLYNIQKSKIT
ncbi:uncharacterized protein METZ01_LOCUS189836, partial [marine metagenome]